MSSLSKPLFVAACLGLLAGPAMAYSAPSPLQEEPKDVEVPPPNIDTNEDGVADAWDLDGDGQPDIWDIDGNGQPDAWDRDGDNKPDVFDTNGDGQPDSNKQTG